MPLLPIPIDIEINQTLKVVNLKYWFMYQTNPRTTFSVKKTFENLLDKEIFKEVIEEGIFFVEKYFVFIIFECD